MRLDPLLYDLSARQHGCIAVWQLRELGAFPAEITRLRASKQWQPLSQRVLARVGSPSTARREACAAVLEAGRGSALMPSSAATLWGLGASYQLLPACVMTDRPRTSFRGDIGYIYPRRNVPDRWITVLDGIPTVRPELCIFLLCGLVDQRRAERALDTGLSMGLVSITSMQLCLAELAKRGRNGTVALRDLLRVRPIGFTPVATGLEARFQDIVGRGWRRQVDSGGEMWAGRVDFRHEVHPVIVEVLSERYHAALSFRRDDEIRRAELEAAGFIVVEVWDRDVWHAPDDVRTLVKAAVRRIQGAA
jgi:very-short-patch-repair endonuclease